MWLDGIIAEALLVYNIYNSSVVVTQRTKVNYKDGLVAVDSPGDGWTNVYFDATWTASGARPGLMSVADFTKLAGIASAAAALASTTPAAVGTAAVGVGTTAARSDHVHAHGNQASGTLMHAAAISGGANGFMSGTDKAKLDAIEGAADVTDFTNVSAALAAANGSIDVNAQNIVDLKDPVNPQDAATKASSELYTPGAASNWAGTPPATKDAAIDRLAAHIRTGAGAFPIEE